MKIVEFRIPKSITLPGLVIQVKQVTPEELGGNADGSWDYDPATGKAEIRINKRLKISRRRYILIHELQHVMTDYLHVALTSYGRWVEKT